jgi:hypothetical protein
MFQEMRERGKQKYIYYRLYYPIRVVEWFVIETLSMRVRAAITKFQEHLQ